MCLLRVGENITSVLTALERLRGEKLVLKRLVLVLMDLDRRLDGRGSNRSWTVDTVFQDWEGLCR